MALILFDIDGTLISAGGAGRVAFNRAFFDHLGADDALSGIRLAGNTDHLIVEDVYRGILGRKPTAADDVSGLLDGYVKHLQKEIDAMPERFSVLEGAVDLVHELDRDDQVMMGLATGNLESAARIKLTPTGLNPFLRFGGFGSDGRHRTEILAKAIERAQPQAQARWCRSWLSDEIWVIGDTEFDVEAARALGVRSVGVLAGSKREEALTASQPDIIVQTLRDPRLRCLNASSCA